MLAHELISLVVRSNTSIEEVLQKALEFAAEIHDFDAVAWLNEEIRGYAVAARLPDYRRLKTFPAIRQGDPPSYERAKWAPAHIRLAEERVEVFKGVPELLQILKDVPTDAIGVLQTSAPANSVIDTTGRLRQGYRVAGRGTVFEVFNAVRERILKWAQEIAKQSGSTTPAQRKPSSKKRANGRVFIVHGHNHGVRDAIDLYLTKDLGLETMVMQAGPSGGRTLPEKLEETARETSFAIFILTADDVLVDTRTNQTIRRARQNVILEIGYFWALLGRRDRVVFLVDAHAEMELPSDLDGLEHILITTDLGQTKLQLKNELQRAGLFEESITRTTTPRPRPESAAPPTSRARRDSS